MAARKPSPKPAKRAVKPQTTIDGVRTVAHLVDTASQNLAHAQRHVTSMATARTQTSRAFNKQHAAKHLRETTEHLKKLNQAVKRVPGVRAEMKALKNVKRRSS